MQTSRMPPMLAISVAPSRHSFDALRKAKQFVIAYPAAGQEEETVLYGTASGRNMDKLARGGTRVVPATKIDSVLMVDALANFECELAGEFVTGDHSIFVGKIVAAHINKDRNVRRIYAFGYVDYAPVERGE
jgi:flavin reductase (DIM6/NTAB) family NADH-FMN oxidoreductase RutF